jgi:hypothetical protein
MFHNLRSGKACASSIAESIAASLIEGMLAVAENHSGTSNYNCPNVAKCAVLTTLAQIGNGVLTSIKASSGVAPLSGLLVLAAGLTALSSASCFSKRPDLQVFLEPASLAMIWAAASTV